MKMLLDLLHGPPASSRHGGVTASPSFTSLQEQLRFSEILFPEASSSMPLHILQEGAGLDAHNAIGIRTHESCSGSQSLPLYHSNYLHTLIQQNDHHHKFEYAPTMHQRSGHDTQLAESRGCHSGAETLALPQLSPRHSGKDASKPSTSTATSDPSSTLENMDACGIVPAQESHWQSSAVRAVSTLRLKDATQHSCQTSLDEGSSRQENLPYVTMGEDTCQRTASRADRADESCSFDNCSARNVHNHAGADDSVIVSRPPTRKRKRSKGCKNSEEVESQRMTHIAVERNRRKQMNEHLSVLRSIMPSTYIQRGDQASIIGGAIDFLKELEHVLQSLQTQKNHKHKGNTIFEELVNKQHFSHHVRYGSEYPSNEEVTHVTCESMDVDVRMIGTSALVKVLAQKLPHQLLKVIQSIESFHMRIMHLNITTIDKSVLYSFNLEVQRDSEFQSANGIAHLIQSIFKVENQCSAC